MEVKYQNLGLKEGYLYEILATTISFKDNDLIPNTSCMGIKIINLQKFKNQFFNLY